MKNYLFFVTFFISIIGCSKMENSKNPEDDSFTIDRGLNVSHWISQSEKRGVERNEYMTAEDFKVIADMGFDHVRIPIDEEQMWTETGEKEDDAFKLMHNAVGWSFENNLRVIIDLHVLRSHHFNRPDSRKLWEDKSAQEGFIKYWHELSKELEKYPNSKLAYEPLNEAVSDNPDDWNNLINWVIAEIRKLEPNRTIIMGSNNWQQVGSFKDLRVPENDKNIILSFHYYEPFLLTHYKAGWTPIKNLDVQVNYPGKLISEESYSKLDEELSNYVKDRNQIYNKSVIDTEIKQAVDIANKYGLKLYCGEYGAFPTTDLSMRVVYYKDLISVFDKYDIAWTHWNYKNDFPLVDEDLKPITELMQVLIP